MGKNVPQAKYRASGDLRYRYVEINQAMRRTLTGRIIQRRTIDEPAVELCQCSTCKGKPRMDPNSLNGRPQA